MTPFVWYLVMGFITGMFVWLISVSARAVMDVWFRLMRGTPRERGP